MVVPSSGSGAGESSPAPVIAPARSEDPAWLHGKVVLRSKNSTICLYCNKKIGGGGITRLKYHLAGKKGQVEACKNVSDDVKWQMKQLIAEIELNDERRKRTRNEIGSIGCADPDSQEESTSVSDSRGRPPTPTVQSSPLATQTIKERSFFCSKDNSRLVAWWENFGHDTPELQAFAVRVLSQCCSATGCERNWSVFEGVFSEKRSRLEQSRLNDLVFVRYNLKLRERILRRAKEALDPISLDNIDLLAEWVSEEPALLSEDDFNWESINAPFATMSLAEEEELGSVADADVAPVLPTAHQESGNDHLMSDPLPDDDPFYYVDDAAAD